MLLREGRVEKIGEGQDGGGERERGGEQRWRWEQRQWWIPKSMMCFEMLLLARSSYNGRAKVPRNLSP